MHVRFSAAIAAATVFLVLGIALASEGASAGDRSGVYVGAHGGGSFASVDYNHNETAGVGGPVVTREPFDTDPRDWSGGFQLGYLYQFGNWVAGIEGAYTFQDLEDSAFTNLGGDPRTRRTEIGDMWSIAGRVGVVSGPWLGYGKIGYANAEIGFVNIRNATGAVLGASEKREAGFLLGAGLEYALTDQLSLGLDYTAVVFDVGRHQQYRGGVAVPAYNDDVDPHLHQISVRLNYRFDFGRHHSALK